MFLNKRKTIINILSLFLLVSSDKVWADCSKCSEKNKELKSQVMYQSRAEEFLRRNQARLATQDKYKDESKIIKLKSNIVILDIKMETVKNNIEAVKQELAKLGCSQCLL